MSRFSAKVLCTRENDIIVNCLKQDNLYKKTFNKTITYGSFFTCSERGKTMHPFFNRNPETVAEELLGKVLQVNRHIYLIDSVLPQRMEDNIRWQKKPLFREHQPVDVYVSGYRGSLLLFFRTQQGTCVRIDGVESGGKVITSPGQVCKLLGLQAEQTGDLEFDGTVVKIRWHK